MTTTVSFIAQILDEIQAVEALMRRQADGYHEDLASVMDLLISAGGKRVRPALTILTGKMFGPSTDRLLYLATAIELLHTATLVHDDLIDGALLRRGMPTLNAKWSPATTVLTGDFIFANAARLVAETNSIPVVKQFSKTLAVIVEGEIVQLLGSRCVSDRASYLKRIYAKTASLFETSTWTGSLVAGAPDDAAEKMRRFGYEIGMAFQIVDDILDFTGEQSKVGKPVGNDLRQGIVTLPVIHYVEEHPWDPLILPLREGECLSSEQTERLVDAVRTSKAIQQSHQEAVDYVERGLECLRAMPPSPERFALEDLANYIVERKM